MKEEYWETTARRVLEMLRGDERPLERIAETIGYLKARIETYESLRRAAIRAQIVPSEKTTDH
jgi:hypothetical protein